MLIDRESSESTRLYVYSRVRTPLPREPRENHPFLWQEYGAESEPLLKSLCALVNTLEAASYAPVRVGVCGVNNVGKSRLVSALRDALGQRYRVQLVPDQFRVAHGSRDLHDTYHVFLSQLLTSPEAHVDICIFDRTLLDNFCFLVLRSQNHEKVYRSLSGTVASEMKKFDLLLHVKRGDADYSESTTFVTGKERAEIRRKLENFILTHDLKSVDVVLDGTRFDESLRAAVNECVKQVNELIRRRREAG